MGTGENGWENQAQMEIGFVSAAASVGAGPTGDQRPTTHTAGGPAGAPCCQDIPHTNEKSQVSLLRYLTFLAGAEGLEPSARGFGDRCSTN